MFKYANRFRISIAPGIVEMISTRPSVEDGACNSLSQWARPGSIVCSGAGPLASACPEETAPLPANCKLTACLIARASAPLARALTTPQASPRNSRPRYGRTKVQILLKNNCIRRPPVCRPRPGQGEHFPPLLYGLLRAA